MSTNVAAPLRVTDSERESVVGLLHAAVGKGRIGLDEFDSRAERAYAAHTPAELSELTSDLIDRPGPFPPRMVAPSPTRVVGEPVVARFGAITVTDTTVHTPTGTFPRRDATWHCTDAWQSRQVTPGWAIALAVLGFFIVPFVSLLFLLIRETRTTGMLHISVTDGIRQHVAGLPVGSPAQVRAIEYQVAVLAGPDRGGIFGAPRP